MSPTPSLVHTLTRDRLRSISKLEFLDEVEELELLLDHYCVAWGVKVPPSKRQEIESRSEGWAPFAGQGLLGSPDR